MFKFVFLFFVFLNFSSINLVHIEIKESKLTDNQRPKSLISLKTELGNLIGYKKEVLNRTINIFYGVPFAEPPIGKQRFKKSKLIQQFPEDPYYALDFKPHCAHKRPNYHHINDRFAEDCLYMNIFTPNLDHQKCKEKYSVMIYINGGKSSMYQMSPFLDSNKEGHIIYGGDLFPALHDTIFITFNYRQDLFATLYVHNRLNGSLGLFDQNLVLLWVKKYIKDFCGDDQNLTLIGNSYGAVEISLHLLSKYSKNLIKNAILLSGNYFFRAESWRTTKDAVISSLLAINDLGCINYTDPQITEHINELDDKTKFKFFKFNDDKYLLKKELFLRELTANHNKIKSKLTDENDKDDFLDFKVSRTAFFLSKYSVDLNCLQNLPTERVIDVDDSYITLFSKDHYDLDFTDTETYLDYKLFNKLNLNPNVNILSGVMANEACSDGLFLKNKYYTDQFNAPKISKEDTKELIKELDFLNKNKKEFKQYIANYYTDETKWRLSRGYYDSYTNLMSDQTFICPGYFFSNYASFIANSVQSYCITYRATKHLSSNNFGYDLNDYAWMTPCHSDECNYLFGLPWRVPNQFTDLDRKFSLKLIQLFTSFAKNGKMPNQSNGEKWPISNKQNPRPRFVEINHNYLREREFEFQERCEQFWGKYLTT